MASITWPAVVAFAPQLAAVPLSFQTDVLAYVNDALEVDKFGGEDGYRTRVARINLAAHMGEMWIRKGQGGAITSENVSATSVAIGYAAPWHGLLDALDSTSYGIEFNRIVGSLAAVRMPVVW